VQTAWLKLHHPVAFMAALMNSMLDNTPKIAGYIQYCRQNGIPILPPDVNKSVWPFSVDKDENGVTGIRFGLGGIKNVGHGAVKLIEKERAKGAFENIFDFAERCGGDNVNKRTVESLIKAGAFDSTPHHRNQLIQVFESVMDDIANKRRSNVAGQMSLFDIGIAPSNDSISLYNMPEVPRFPLKYRLSMEREMTGVYISGHPLDEVADLLRTGFTTVADVQELASQDDGVAYDGMQVTMGGILTSARNKMTRKGQMMGLFELEDLTGQIEGLVFPKLFDRYAFMLETDAMVIIDGRLNFREEEDPKLIVETIRPLDRQNAQTHAKNPKEAIAEARGQAQMNQRAKEERQKAAEESRQPRLTDAQLAKQSPRKLYVLLPSRKEMKDVKSITALYPGSVPVYMKIQDEGIALLLSRDSWCDASESILEEFRALCGNDGVVLRE